MSIELLKGKIAELNEAINNAISDAMRANADMENAQFNADRADKEAQKARALLDEVDPGSLAYAEARLALANAELDEASARQAFAQAFYEESEALPNLSESPSLLRLGMNDVSERIKHQKSSERAIFLRDERDCGRIGVYEKRLLDWCAHSAPTQISHRIRSQVSQEGLTRQNSRTSKNSLLSGLRSEWLVYRRTCH